MLIGWLVRRLTFFERKFLEWELDVVTVKGVFSSLGNVVCKEGFQKSG